MVLLIRLENIGILADVLISENFHEALIGLKILKLTERSGFCSGFCRYLDGPVNVRPPKNQTFTDCADS